MAFAHPHAATRRSKDASLSIVAPGDKRAVKLHQILQKQNNLCRRDLVKSYVIKHMMGEHKHGISSPAARKLIDEMIDQVDPKIFTQVDSLTIKDEACPPVMVRSVRLTAYIDMSIRPCRVFFLIPFRASISFHLKNLLMTWSKL